MLSCAILCNNTGDLPIDIQKFKMADFVGLFKNVTEITKWLTVASIKYVLTCFV